MQVSSSHGRLKRYEGKTRSPKKMLPKLTFREHPEVPGLLIMEDAISPEVEGKLIKCIDQHNSWDGGWLKRRTAHYGFRYNYDTGTIGERMEIPLFIRRTRWFIEKLINKHTSFHLEKEGATETPADKESSDWTAAIPSYFDQSIANEYMPGQGIGRHTDRVKLFTRLIAILCLGSDTTMVFRLGSRKTVPVRLRKRALVLMTGESRYSYTHEIAPVKSDIVDGQRILRSRRISLTFRRQSKN